MQKLLVLIEVLFILSGTLLANDGNVPPVAVLTEDPDRTWFYNAEEVIFSGASSTDVDGTVNYYRFYVNGSLKYQGSSSNYSTCFVLNGSANSGCYELGSGATTVSIKLGARDNSGEWDYQTISYTIQEHKGRKYFITDHLGSVRATINRDGNVLGYDDYYPFGLSMPGRSANTANPNDLYKFTGHERDEEAGLTLDYMNARNYDPITGRFLQIDPLSDMFPSLNPYHYVYNNPLGFTDPTGMAPMGYGMNNEQNYSGVNVMTKDKYKLNQSSGKVELEEKNDDETDQLYAENGESIEVSKRDDDTSVLSDLADGNNAVETSYNGTDYQGIVANTNNGGDARRVFDFAANNSNVEWSYQAFTDGSFSLSTANNPNITTTGSLHSSNFGKVIAHDVHNHPVSIPRDRYPSGGDALRAAALALKNPSIKVWLYVPQNLGSNRLWDIRTMKRIN